MYLVKRNFASQKGKRNTGLVTEQNFTSTRKNVKWKYTVLQSSITSENHLLTKILHPITKGIRIRIKENAMLVVKELLPHCNKIIPSKDKQIPKTFK